MKKTKLILSVCTAAMVTATAFVLPATIARNNNEVKVEAADGVHVSTWNDLNEAIDDASNGTTIILDADIKSDGGGSDRIKVDGKKNLTIDLNGFNVDRNRTSNAKSCRNYLQYIKRKSRSIRSC